MEFSCRHTGLFEVLEKHAPLVSALKAGRLKVIKDRNNQVSYFEIQGGFVEVLNNNVTVLVEGASLVEVLICKHFNLIHDPRKNLLVGTPGR
jgi:F-type H+-transporting ATPase subunit epsilon